VKDRLGGKAHGTGARPVIARLKTEWLGRWDAKLRSTERPINPYFVMSEFMRVIPSEDAIVTHDSGSPRDQLLPMYVAKMTSGYMGWGKRVYDPAQVVDAILRARRQNEDGKACLLEFITSAETAFSHRRGAA